MKRRMTAYGVGALLAALALASSAQGALGPRYAIKATWGDTVLRPGDTKASTPEGQFSIWIRNVGDAAGTEKLTITDKLPSGVTATAISWPDPQLEKEATCTGVSSNQIECTVPAKLVSSEVPPAGAKAEFNPFSPSPTGNLAPIFVDVSIPKNATGEGANTATVKGGSSVVPSVDIDQIAFGDESIPFGIVPGSLVADNFTDAFPEGVPARQASDRPFELRVDFDFTARTGVNSQPGEDGTRYIAPNGSIRTVEATLPRGMIGNPEAVPKCDPVDFSEPGSVANSTACSPNTQVGYLTVYANDGSSSYGGGNLKAFDWVLLNRVPLYNLVPPKGVIADLGFRAGGLVQAHIYPTPDPAQNYAIKSVTPNISSLVQVRGSEVTLWGVPGDPAHDAFRYFTEVQKDGSAAGAPWDSAPIRPFLTNPMDCGFENGGTRIRVDSYNQPGQFSPNPAEEYPVPLNVGGCDDPRFRFEPDISLQPTDTHAGAPTGLDVHLEVPQRNDEVKDADELYAANGFAKAMATPPVKKAVITFPEGMTLSPSAAQGLGSCSLEQIGLNTDRPVTCPDNSQYGTLTLHTPLFPSDAQPEGWIYIAKQSENPFQNFLALYLVVQEPERGVLIKVPGRIDLDPRTGQITATFDDLPQFPVSDMQIRLRGGLRAGLVEPSTCGRKTITAQLYSWQDPTTPHPVNSFYDIVQRPDGSNCVNNLGERPFSPAMEAGTTNSTAGTYAPFVFRLTRSDDDQEFSQLGLSMAEGLIGKLAGIGRCSDAGIAQAEGRTGAGDGAVEERQPSCPPSSLIGTTQVGAGVGVPLTYVPGKVYLAGPYRGSPLSVVAISPAVVGPYDLGVIAVRTALNVNPVTTRVSALTDPLPQIFQGIPVRIRDIRVNLDRRDFILNPTSCAEKQIDAHVTGTGGDVASTADDTGADLAKRFQAADCASLGFKPRLSFRLFGATHRGGHPRLRAVVRGRPGDANIGGASVALPHSEFLDQAHIKTVCTRVQFAAGQCPPGSVYGHVTAKTPLFDESFSGPVYLRSSSHPLPDVVAVLRGPASLPIEVDLAGRVDSVNGGIRNTFEVVPDAPVTSFVLTLKGGKKGLLVNSTNLCAGTHRATAKFSGQNGKRITLRPALRADCARGAKRNGRHHRALAG